MPQTLWTLLFVLTQSALVMAGDKCPDRHVAGIVLGTIACTLLVVAVIAGIVYLVWRNKQKKAKPTNKANHTQGKETYENPTFQGDVEMGETEPEKGPSFAEMGFGGYVECREYRRSPPADVEQPHRVKVPSKIVEIRDPEKAKQRLTLMSRKGSHGSLNSFPVNDAEMVSVQLVSHDIIGLGFNVCGSISNGIYVDEVLNRGPANESGLIKTGDRIMSLTISFKNMVYEDALTILSYASAYPVRILLQKASETASSGRFVDIELNSNIRSQSLNDISKINKDATNKAIASTQSTAVEPPTVLTDGGNLPKLSGAVDGIERSVKPKISQISQMSQSPSEYSMEFPDMRIDTTDMLSISTNATVHKDDDDSAKDVAIDIDGDKGITMAAPQQMSTVVKHETLDVGDLSEQDKLDMIRLSYENPDDTQINVMRYTTGVQNSAPNDERNNNTITSSATFALESEIEKQLPNAAIDKSDKVAIAVDVDDSIVHVPTETDTSLEVNVGDISTELPKTTTTETESEHGDKALWKLQDEGAKAVLQDYFGDQPALLSEFGLASEGARRHVMVERNSLEVEDVNSMSSVQSEKSCLSAANVDVGTLTLGNGDAQSESPLISRRSDGGVAFDVKEQSTDIMSSPRSSNVVQDEEEELRRNIGYFVRLDEPHNPAPEVYNLTFQVDDLPQPPLIRSGEAVSTTSVTRSSDRSDTSSPSVLTEGSGAPTPVRRLIRPLITDTASESGSDSGSRTNISHNGNDVEDHESVGLSSVSLKSGSSGSAVVERGGEITVTKADDRAGAYTIHVQPQLDDSEA